MNDATVELQERIRATGKRIYCIAFSPRSGSTALAHDLERCGLGFPIEPFQRLAYLREHTGRPVVEHIVDLVESAPGRFFGFKIAWEQAARLSRALADEGIAVSGHDLRSVFPELTHLHLVREDKLAQAVSAWRARTSGRWHQRTDEPAPVVAERHDTPEDLDTIRSMFLQFVAEDWLWRDLFRRTRLPATVVTYERYVDDRLGTLRSVAEAIGGPSPAVVPEGQTRILADDRSTELADKLRVLLDAPTSPWWALTDADDPRSADPPL